MIGGERVIGKVTAGRKEAVGEISLKNGQVYRVQVDYHHEKGDALGHIRWSGPDFTHRLLTVGDQATAK